MSSDQDRRDFYSRIAAQYDQTVVNDVRYEAHVIVPQRLIELYGKPEARVLDLACGTGLGSLRFFEAGFDVVGVDYSSGMINVAKTRPYVELFCQSIEDELPVADRSFDIVTALGVTEFILDPAALLKRIWRALKDNGLCALTVPKPTSAAAELKINTYAIDDFLNFIDQADYRVLDQIEFYGWESGHLAKLDGREGDPHHRVDYVALFLEKKGHALS